MSSPAKADTTFHWSIYADATAAGLAVLIPIPILDWLFEEFFRRRMPATIAHRHQINLPAPIKRELNRGDAERGWLSTCLLLPLKGIYWFIKTLSKKILYFLTIKEAADQVSRYWHQAFLINYMFAAGHLSDKRSAKAARQAMWQVIEASQASPLLQLAQQVVSGTRHIMRSLFRLRRGQEDELIAAKKSEMRGLWVNFADYFAALAALYDQAYPVKLQMLLAEEQALAAAREGHHD